MKYVQVVKNNIEISSGDNPMVSLLVAIPLGAAGAS
jgi:hypothetical protein